MPTLYHGGKLKLCFMHEILHFGYNLSSGSEGTLFKMSRIVLKFCLISTHEIVIYFTELKDKIPQGQSIKNLHKGQHKR